MATGKKIDRLAAGSARHRKALACCRGRGSVAAAHPAGQPCSQDAHAGRQRQLHVRPERHRPAEHECPDCGALQQHQATSISQLSYRNLFVTQHYEC